MSISASLRNSAQLKVSIQAGSAGGLAVETYAGPYAVTPQVDYQAMSDEEFLAYRQQVRNRY